MKIRGIRDGQAVLLFGQPRLTRDIDVTLCIGIDHLDAQRKFLQSR
ncbi:MAG: hypothetical protein ABSG75_02325 [Syntrophales bacterium]